MRTPLPFSRGGKKGGGKGGLLKIFCSSLGACGGGGGRKKKRTLTPILLRFQRKGHGEKGIYHTYLPLPQKGGEKRSSPFKFREGKRITSDLHLSPLERKKEGGGREEQSPPLLQHYLSKEGEKRKKENTNNANFVTLTHMFGKEKKKGKKGEKLSSRISRKRGGFVF